MASYSTNANVQNLVYGTTNSDLDTASTNARDVATSIINAHFNIVVDISSPSEAVTRCCSLLAAGILSTSPDENLEQNGYYKAGMALLMMLPDSSDDAPWTTNIVADRFDQTTGNYTTRGRYRGYYF
jgi:hypothetical protein